MKRKILFAFQIILFGLFNFSLLITAFQFFGNDNPLAKYDPAKPTYNHVEAYDPSLMRLNSLKKVEQYCDSLYAEKILNGAVVGDFGKTYTEIVSSVIKNRFYHGYSHYGMSNNFVALLVSEGTIPGLSAVVIPDEILKYPFAACSQQCIVMMEVLKSKGFKTRKVGFVGKNFGGHFAFEVQYNKAWHFNDPNLEPDKQVLDAYGEPGIDYLAKNPEVLLKAYNRYPKEKIMDIFPNYYYGSVNTFPAQKAVVFQRVTQFLSYTIWLFFLVAFILVRRNYIRLTNRPLVPYIWIPSFLVPKGNTSVFEYKTES